MIGIPRRAVFLILTLAVWVSFLSGDPLCGAPRKGTPLKPYDRAYEINNLVRVDLLPQYRTGSFVEQVSSYDPTGGNDDGFTGTYSYLRKEPQGLVIAELQGPGVINRIWTPTPSGDTLKFFFDGESTPRLVICFADLFSGDVFPFMNPICGNELGGFYSYLPIPYAKSCKIILCAQRMLFYQIQYRDLLGYDVKSYDPQWSEIEKSALERVAFQWNNSAPKPTDYGRGRSRDWKIEEQEFLLKPGEEVTFFQTREGGRIIGFELDAGVGFEGMQKDILLEAFWDDEPTAAIYAPAADFFGYAFGQSGMRSMIIGRRDLTNYSYWPMPFDHRATLKLKYIARARTDLQHPVWIRARVVYNVIPRDPVTEGRFHALWRREIEPAKGVFYTFAHLKGKGHYVGTMQLAQGLKADMTLFFEGDDSTYVDGQTRIHGTGSEDYFNGGWYALLDRWDRGVSLPIHGAIDYNLPQARTGGYRLYMSDKMPYEQEFYMGIEHGPQGNEFPVDYASMAYYYSEEPVSVPMEPIEVLRNVYVPKRFTYFPQMMQLTLSRAVAASYHYNIALEAQKECMVRVMLGDIPQGQYRVLLNYMKGPQGAEFSLWHRQAALGEWHSSYAPQVGEVSEAEMGTGYFTPQTNSLSIHVRPRGGADRFEFGCLILEQVR